MNSSSPYHGDTNPILESEDKSREPHVSSPPSSSLIAHRPISLSLPLSRSLERRFIYLFLSLSPLYADVYGSKKTIATLIVPFLRKPLPFGFPLSLSLFYKQMCFPRLISFFLALFCLARVLNASAGDADPVYRSCVVDCEKTGCVGEKCFQHCKFSSDGKPVNGPWYMQEPLYLKWKHWDCRSDCRYHCMLAREEERQNLGDKPVKYHGKWPFQRVYGIQEPVSVAFSALNLSMHFHGWLSFFILLYYKLPLRPNKKTFYEYACLWHIYGLLAMNSWFWSAVFHSRDVDFTEKLDYSSAVALLGFSLILAVLRAFNVRDEAARVMVAAPLLAFITTHILYLNFYKLDYGLNMKVCVGMGLAQLLIWAIWAGVTHHPSRWKLWFVVVGGGLAMLLEIYDFPPYMGYVDAHALWHATTIPLTYLWWSFVRDDAEFRTTTLLKKAK